MPTLPILRRTFRRAIASAMALGPSLSACGPGPGIQKDPDFVPARCAANADPWEANLWLEGLMPAQAADYVELQRAPSFVREDEPQITGQACKTATMVSACQDKLAELRAIPAAQSQQLLLFAGGDSAVTGRLLITRRDEVFAVESGDQLISFLSPIDAPDEAMLLVQNEGYNVRCGGGGARPVDDGFEVQAYRSVGCGGLDRYLIAVHSDGSVEELDRDRLKDPERGCAVGRRPAGLFRVRRVPDGSAGAYLARAAALEAASVEAFRRLAAELRVHGAPEALVEAALAAARDEVRHARTVARLAWRLGASAAKPVIDDMPLRGLEQVASENAREGCVRETFGALEGQWMARHAGDARVRRAYRRIAEDELRHAALAWRVAGWIEPRLEQDARRRVNEVRQAAIVDLRRSLTEEPSADQRALCGVPSAREAGVLFAAMLPAIS